MSQPRPVLFSDDSNVDAGFLSFNEGEGTMLSQDCASLSLLTPENSCSFLSLPTPAGPVSKPIKRNKRVRARRGSKTPPENESFSGIPSFFAPKKGKRVLGSPLPRVGSDMMLSGTASPREEYNLTFTLRTRDVADFPRSASMLSEDSLFGAHRTLSMYATEFTELAEIGRGAFGRVVKAKKRTDGVIYAVKVSWTPIKGERDQEARSREVHALARCDHPHVLRYYSSWIEDGLMYLQTEYCVGGNVSKKPAAFWTQQTALQLLTQISSALKYLHSHKMAHLDVKGENIFATADDTFKLGDFGLVANMEEAEDIPRSRSMLFSQDSCASLEEGDRKYLSPELLNDKTNLPAADVFALGISVYELCRGEDLPGNGEEWHRLRHGQLGPLPQLSADLYALIRRMMDRDPLARPSAAEVEAVCLAMA